MKGKTWFGTRGFETWVPTPKINPDYARAGYSATGQFLNGGAGVRQSRNAHNIYTLAWPIKSRDQIRLITDFAEGVFDLDAETNLIYWVDPVAAPVNVLAQTLATAHLACEDGVPWIRKADGTGRPTPIETPANAFRYPARSAQYSQTSTSKTIEQYIPIPPGYSAWVGIHGDGSTAGRFRVQRVDGYTTVGTPVVPTVLGLTSTRVNTEFASTSSSGIVIQVVPTVSPVTFTLYGMVVQILPTGTTPVIGDFVSGQGHSGCQFVGQPMRQPYSAALDKVALTAKLEETGLYV